MGTKAETSFLINSLAKGGAERQSSLLINHIPFKKVVLLQKPVDYPIDPKVHVQTLALGKVFWIFLFPIYFFKLLLSFRESKKVLSFLDISNYLNIITGLFPRGHGSIVSIRTNLSRCYSKGLKSFIHKFLIRLLYPKATLLIANSEGSRLDMVKNFDIPEEKIKVIRNGYDLDAINKLAAENVDGSLLAREAIVTVGRFMHSKGHREMLEIFSKIKKKGYGGVLLIIGSGPLQARLTEFAFQLGIEKDVFFLGSQDNPFKFISKSRLFLFCSFWEGCPNVLAESLICGTPVASSDCPNGPRELLFLEKENIVETEGAEGLKIYEMDGGVLLPTFSMGQTPEERAALVDLWSDYLFGLLNDEKKMERFKQSTRLYHDSFCHKKVIDQWRQVLSL